MVRCTAGHSTESLTWAYLISSWFLKSTFCSEVGYIFTVILSLQPGGKSQRQEMKTSPYQTGRGGKKNQLSFSLSLLSMLVTCHLFSARAWPKTSLKKTGGFWITNLETQWTLFHLFFSKATSLMSYRSFMGENKSYKHIIHFVLWVLQG